MDYFKFSATLGLFFVLPGLSVLYLMVRPKLKLTAVEYLVFAVGLSLVLVNFLGLGLDHFGFALNASHLIKAIALVIALPLVASTFPSLKTTFMPGAVTAEKAEKSKARKEKVKAAKPDPAALRLPPYLQLKNKQLIVGAILVGLSLLIHARFLVTDIVPNNTDLGHHAYYPRLMEIQEKIPVYETSDVIVGEHIPFAVLAKISGVSLLSAFPVIFLLFINLIGALALYALSLRIFKNQTLAGLVFGLTQVLYAIVEPAGKFVSGGVVGNIYGNLMIPLVLLAVWLAWSQKKSELMAAGLFLFFGLLYIHHLSAFLLIFILVFSWLLFSLIRGVSAAMDADWTGFGKMLLSWGRLFLAPLPLLVIGFFAAFFFLIYTPHYIREAAVTTVVQAPEKDTHQGVSLASFVSSVGEWRSILGLAGLGLLIGLGIAGMRRRELKAFSLQGFGRTLMAGWSLILLGLAFVPQLFLVDLPSRRVVNYLVAPLAILMAFLLVQFFRYLKTRLSPQLLGLIFVTLTLALTLNGFAASLKLFKADNQFAEVVGLYHAGTFLAEKSRPEDVILKDHANLGADTWLKFFFLRGYDYVLSRTFDYKYEDPTKPRDPCPLDMAVAPETAAGQECFEKTGTDWVILKKDVDNFFFDQSDGFGKVYDNGYQVIYKQEADK